MIKDIFNRLSAAVGRMFNPAPPAPPAKPPKTPVVAKQPAPSPITAQQVPPVREPEKTTPEPAAIVKKSIPRRLPRMWNIGLDFGTAFTKCIVRRSDEAFIVPLLGDQFLLPSDVYVGKSKLGLSGDSMDDERPVRVQNLKMALAEFAEDNTAGLWAANFLQLREDEPQIDLFANPTSLTIYFLARTIQKAKAFILTKSPDFNEAHGDRCFINMAVPVAHAEKTLIADKFEHCLRQAWLLASESNLPNWDQQQIGVALKNLNGTTLSADELPCYLYPEVSANVQSYIKSRAGADGLYLFVDVGAGTVDLSIFIYYTHPSNDRPITYIEAGVIHLGSSQIEIRVAQNLIQNTQRISTYCDGISPADTGQILVELQEVIRAVKEGRKKDEFLFQTMRATETLLEDELLIQAAKVLGVARIKMIQDANGQNLIAGADQWRRLQLLIGGGGAGSALYSNAVNAWFDLCRNPRPAPKPMPLPQDLKWPASFSAERQASDFRRFTVAYGLSFYRADLEEHRYPKEVHRVAGVYEETTDRPHAPSKDEC